MKILHVIPAVAPRYGGPSTAIVAMCDALNRMAGIQAEVVATDADGEGTFDAKEWPSTMTPLHLFPCDGRRLKQSSRMRTWLNDHTQQYDVVHSHSAWNEPVYLARFFANKYLKPLVYRPCGMLSPYTWTKGRMQKTGYWWWRERSNVHTASAIHCTSQAEADEVRHYGLGPGSITVIPLGVDEHAWNRPVHRQVLRDRCGAMAEDRPIILFLSRLHPKKGIVDVLLPAMTLLKSNAVLAVVGGVDDSTPHHGEDISTTIKQLALQDRVFLLGSVNQADRWNHFDGADVFVLPSHQENFGLVVAEAMARGLPVVITDNVQLAADVKAARAGIVTARTPEHVAVALDHLLSDPQRQDYRTRAIEYARSHFDWDHTASRLVRTYQQVLGTPA